MGNIHPVYSKGGLPDVDHWTVDTPSGKNLRVNSQTYTTTVGQTGQQIKPRAGATVTGDYVGLESSPGINAGFGGESVVSIKADVVLKAGSGNLNGGVVGVQSNLDFGTSGTRTITGDVSAFEAFLAIPSTYTYSGDISFFRVRTVNIKGWDLFLNLDDANTGLSVGTAGTYSTADGYLKIKIGSTAYRIPFFAGVD